MNCTSSAVRRSRSNPKSASSPSFRNRQPLHEQGGDARGIAQGATCSAPRAASHRAVHAEQVEDEGAAAHPPPPLQLFRPGAPPAIGKAAAPAPPARWARPAGAAHGRGWALGGRGSGRAHAGRGSRPAGCRRVWPRRRDRVARGMSRICPHPAKPQALQQPRVSRIEPQGGDRQVPNGDGARAVAMARQGPGEGEGRTDADAGLDPLPAQAGGKIVHERRLAPEQGRRACDVPGGRPRGDRAQRPACSGGRLRRWRPERPDPQPDRRPSPEGRERGPAPWRGAGRRRAPSPRPPRSGRQAARCYPVWR